MVANLAACKAIWMRKLLVGLFRQRMETTMIHCDNQSCIKLSENSVFHKSKHIKIRYHHLKDCVQKGIVKLLYIPTKEQTADILTKALARSSFVHFRDSWELYRIPSSVRGSVEK